MNGCIVLLVDESAAMNSKLSRPPTSTPSSSAPAKTKADIVATAINSLLNKLTQQHDVDIALVGYRTSENGSAEVGARWAGALAGRTFVKSQDLSSAPITIERRIRKVTRPGAPEEEQTIEFPIWYQPVLGDQAPQVAAFEFSKELLVSANTDLQPLIIHITAGASSDGSPLKVIQTIQQSASANAAPLVMHAHLGSSDNVPPTLYPANRAYLTGNAEREFFEATSVLPESFAQVLKSQNTKVVPNARGLIYNGSMLDLTRLLGLIPTHIQSAATIAEAPQPAVAAAATAPSDSAAQEIGDVPPIATPAMEVPTDEVEPGLGSVTTDSPALVAFIFDRSSDAVEASDSDNPHAKLRDQLVELCGQATKVGEGCIDLAIISYGSDAAGKVDVRSTLEGNLAGRLFARDDQLLDGAIRDDSFNEERSNGIGGILTISHIRPVLVELEPALPAPMTPAFAQAAELVASWRSDNPSSEMPPIVLHLTRGKSAAEDATSAVQHLRSGRASEKPLVLYHLVVTGEDHPTALYPSNESELASAELQQLWRLTSLLLCRNELSEENDTITLQSRGFIVNGRFNLLFDAIKRAKEQ